MMLRTCAHQRAHTHTHVACAHAWHECLPEQYLPVDVTKRTHAAHTHPVRRAATAEAMPIYLDYNATTPLDPAVCSAMLPYLQGRFGNPSSGHWYGVKEKEAVETARGRVASLIGAAHASEIIFTSGATSACGARRRPAVRKRRACAARRAALARLPPGSLGGPHSWPQVAPRA